MQKESFAKEFRSLHVDLDKNIYEINGKVVSPKCFYLKLELENGEWSLQISTDEFYTSKDH